MNKKLVLSVLSTAVLTSMAASAMALEPGFYVGGNVDKYYSTTALSKNFKVAVKEVLKQPTVYVDKEGKAANFVEALFADDINTVLKPATPDMFEDDDYKIVGTDKVWNKKVEDWPPVPGTDLKVESVSANNLTKVTVKFNKAVDAVSAENFNIPGLTVESAQLSEDKKTVTLAIAGAEVSKDYKLTITNVKIDAKVQPDITVDFKTPAQEELFKPAVEAKDTVLKSDNASQTLVTFKLKDAAGNLMEDAQDVEVKFSTTWGNMAEQRVTVQKGIATVVFNSEALTSDKVAEITAQVIEAKDKNLIGLKAVTNILLTPNPEAVDPKLGALMGEAVAYQADRVVAYFNKPVSVSDFVFASGANKGAIDPSKAVVEVYTEVDNDGKNGRPVAVIGLLPVQGNERALQLILDKNDQNFPLVDNANVTVKFVDKRGSIQVPSEKSFKITDARKPAMLSVEREGLNKIKVIFSEAIYEDTTDEKSATNLNNWIIDGKSLADKVYGDTQKAHIEVGIFDREKGTDSRHVVTITLGTDKEGNQIYFKPGVHSIQGANIGDWAVKTDQKDNTMNTQTLDFEIPVDNGAPAATVEVQSPEQYLVTFDKDINANAQQLAGVLKLQKYNTETSAWEDVAKPEIQVTNISDLNGTSKYLVETKEDWTQVYNTKDTNKNYYNDSYRLHIDKDKVFAISNGIKNAEINLTLGGAMTFPDVTSPTINQIVKTPETDEGTSYDVTMSEPVKIGSANKEGQTPSQDQDNKIPVPTAEFIKKDNSVTIPANIGEEFVDKENKVIRVTPTKELEAGEWTLVVRSISDDVGNTAASATKDFVVEKPVVNTDFKVVWAYADNTIDPKYDFVFVKFSKEGAITGDHKNITKTANYTLNGKPLPEGSQIFGDIEGYDDMDNITDSITIRLPKDSITRPDRTVINISQYLESTDGELVGNAGIKKLPYNWGTSKTVSDANELKAALADDSLRTIVLGGDIDAPKGLEVNRLVNIDLSGKTITGNVTVNTKEGGKMNITGSGTIEGNLTVNTPNADFTVDSGVTVTGDTTVKDVANSSFINEGTLAKVVIEDPNGSSFENNGTTGDVQINTIGSVTLKGQLENVVANKAAKLTIDGKVATLTATAKGVVLVKGKENVTALSVEGNGSFVDKDGKPIDSKEPVVVDKADLTAKINDAKAKKEADFTPESWTAADLANVIATAEAVLNDDKATQEQVNAQVKAIDDAVAKLVEKTPVVVDKADLTAKINDAKEKKEADFTPESWTAADLANVIAAAEAVLNDDKATQEQVNAQVKAIDDAVAKLKNP